MLLNSGALAFGRTDGNMVASDPAVTDLAWHHVAVTRNAQEVRFYRDGRLASLQPFGETFVLDQTYGLGGMFPSGRNTFLGDLDEISFYDRVALKVIICELILRITATICYCLIMVALHK